MERYLGVAADRGQASLVLLLVRCGVVVRLARLHLDHRKLVLIVNDLAALRLMPREHVAALLRK